MEATLLKTVAIALALPKCISNTQDQCMQQFVKLCAPLLALQSFPFPDLSDIPDIISKTNNLFTTFYYFY